MFEKTNIRYLDPDALPGRADLASIDVSFISLKLVLPRLKLLLIPRHEVIALIKPQFEVGKGQVGKGGVVRSSEEHERVIAAMKTAAIEQGYDLRAVWNGPETLAVPGCPDPTPRRPLWASRPMWRPSRPDRGSRRSGRSRGRAPA